MTSFTKLMDVVCVLIFSSVFIHPLGFAMHTYVDCGCGAEPESHIAAKATSD